MQMHHEVEKYGKFRGKLWSGRQKMWWGRDSEHGGRPQWKGRHSSCPVWPTRLRSLNLGAIGSRGRIKRISGRWIQGVGTSSFMSPPRMKMRSTLGLGNRAVKDTD